MNESMIEKLAKIAESHVRPVMVYGDHPGAPKQLGLGMTGGKEAVLAIITALREPSEDMLRASPIVGTGPDESGRWKTNTEPARIVWQAMIDELLK